MARDLIKEFSVLNQVLARAEVHFLEVDGSGVETGAYITLYAAETGAATLANPQTLDANGMLPQPTYFEAGHIIRMVKPSIGIDQKTGVYRLASAAAVVAFTDLSDAPTSYSGHGNKAVGVKTDATGLEFFIKPTVPDESIDLTDMPQAYPSSSEGQLVAVKTGGGGYALIRHTGHAKPGQTVLGNVSATLTPGTTKRMVRFNSPFTVARTLTLSTTGIYDGAWYAIITDGIGTDFGLTVTGFPSAPGSDVVMSDGEVLLIEASDGAWRKTGRFSLSAVAAGETGPAGPEGPAGEPFTIDAKDTLANRVNYDAQLKDFTFLATDTGDIYFKLSDTNADWSVAFPWQGEDGVTTGFSFDAVDVIANRSTHDAELEGFTFFATDEELLYVKQSDTSGDWTAGISLKGPAGGTAVTIVELTTDHTLVATDIEGKLLRYNTSSNFSVRVPTALKSQGPTIWPFSVMNLGTGTISVVAESGGAGGAEPVVHQTWKFEEAKLFETAPNGSLENGGSITIPTGLTDRYLVVLALTSSETVQGVPDASATFGGVAMDIVQKAPAWVNQSAVRAFAFGMKAPPEGTATVSVTFTGPNRVLTSSVVAVLLTGVDQSVPFEGQAGSDADGVSALNQVLSTSIPANCLILGAATKLRGSATVVATASTYLDNGNCGSTSDSGQRWIVAAESGGAGGAGLDLNFAWDSTKQQSGIAAAFRPSASGGAAVIPALGEDARTAGQYQRMMCMYEAYDLGGVTAYRCFTEGGALAV